MNQLNFLKTALGFCILLAMTGACHGFSSAQDTFLSMHPFFTAVAHRSPTTRDVISFGGFKLETSLKPTPITHLMRHTEEILSC